MFGTWWSVVVHTLFFILLLLRRDMLLFTTIVSIEAIYIGIFILMAANREETVKMKQNQAMRKSDRALVNKDVNISEEMRTEVDEIKRDLELLVNKYKK